MKTKEIVLVGIFSALSYILYTIQFIKYPQGGGISLLSMLPTMLLSIIYGTKIGLLSGFILGFLKLLNGAFIIHPIQFMLDYILANTVLGFCGIFGDKKINIFFGGIFVSCLSTLFTILSGAIFFGDYALEGMNPWIYSIIYNVSTTGIEGILSTIVLLFIPIKRFKHKV